MPLNPLPIPLRPPRNPRPHRHPLHLQPLLQRHIAAPHHRLRKLAQPVVRRQLRHLRPAHGTHKIRRQRVPLPLQLAHAHLPAPDLHRAAHARRVRLAAHPVAAVEQHVRAPVQAHEAVLALGHLWLLVVIVARIRERVALERLRRREVDAVRARVAHAVVCVCDCEPARVVAEDAGAEQRGQRLVVDARPFRREAEVDDRGEHAVFL
ncbi:hypothetical protein DFP73DRAFT_569739 [Morchella snyderi]|nr:hypothetical protein DFP73DRAFT_569739 [Morchella snyderi]